MCHSESDTELSNARAQGLLCAHRPGGAPAAATPHTRATASGTANLGPPHRRSRAAQVTRRAPPAVCSNWGGSRVASPHSGRAERQHALRGGTGRSAAARSARGAEAARRRRAGAKKQGRGSLRSPCTCESAERVVSTLCPFSPSETKTNEESQHPAEGFTSVSKTPPQEAIWFAHPTRREKPRVRHSFSFGIIMPLTAGRRRVGTASPASAAVSSPRRPPPVTNQRQTAVASISTTLAGPAKPQRVCVGAESRKREPSAASRPIRLLTTAAQEDTPDAHHARHLQAIEGARLLTW